jgi:hypothetical protein
MTSAETIANLIAVVEAALAQVEERVHKDASVMVQFAAGDWVKIKEAVAAARAELDAYEKPAEVPAEVTKAKGSR